MAYRFLIRIPPDFESLDRRVRRALIDQNVVGPDLAVGPREHVELIFCGVR